MRGAGGQIRRIRACGWGGLLEDMMSRPVDSVVTSARAFLGDRITVNATLREHHSHGQDTQPPVLPDAVAFIETAEEAARLLALCHAQGVQVVPWGAGTSLEGHVTPVRGGITLDLSLSLIHIS